MWHTAGVDRLGLAGIGVTDGPSGARGAEFTGVGLDVAAVRHGAGLDVEPRADRAGRPPARRRGPRRRAPACCWRPTVNIHRHPLGGRNFECYSEDPYLTAEIAVAFIDGVQSRGVGCAVKHFACNDQETDRMEIDVVVDERTRREIYLPPVRGRRAARRRVGGHGRLQPRRRPVLQRAPRAADRPAARRVGLRRRGDVRLVRHPQRRRARRRARPGDARPADGPRPPPRRSRRGGRRHGRRRRAGRASGSST